MKTTLTEDTMEAEPITTDLIPQRFSSAVAEVSAAKSALEAIDLVEADEDAMDARTVAMSAATVVRAIEEKRKELIRPHLDAQKSINDCAKLLKDGVEGEIQRVKKLVGHYEAEKERVRQAKLRRLEAQRKKREAEERAELERVEKIKNRLASLERSAGRIVTSATDADQLEQLIADSREHDLSAEFDEFASEYVRIKESMLEMAEERVAFLREQARQKEEADRLEGAARRQKEEEIRQAKERQRIVAEKERQQREAESIRRRQDEARQREAGRAARVDVEEERLKKLEADRVKNLRKTWAFEVVDEAAVPPEYKSIDAPKVNAAIRANKAALAAGKYSIPGIRIYADNTVVLK